MNTQNQLMTLQEIINLTLRGQLNPNPIGQRPPTTTGPKKSVQIIKSIVDGYGCGMITVRDISKDIEAQKIYGPNTKYLVIDGGHRVRALRAFYEGKLTVYGKTMLDFEDFSLDQVVPINIRTCTSQEATELFRKINTTTPVNFMEMVMSDEESVVCEYIRSQTMIVNEYGNKTHELFGYTKDLRGDYRVDNFNTDPNPRRKWDEYVAIALIRALKGGLVDAGQPEIEEVTANNPPITEVAKKVVDKFLNDCLALKKFRKKKFNGDTFAAFLVYWFGLYGKNKNFAVEYPEFFADFMTTYSLLTGKSEDLEGEVIMIDNEQVFIKEYVRKNIKNFSNGAVQQHVFTLFERFSEGKGIVWRDEQRSLSSNDAELALASQKYLCAIDGKPLTISDAVFAHDTAWSKGGKSELSNGAMIRSEHNRDMGTLTLDEYRMILQARENVA